MLLTGGRRSSYTYFSPPKDEPGLPEVNVCKRVYAKVTHPHHPTYDTLIFYFAHSIVNVLREIERLYVFALLQFVLREVKSKHGKY